MKSTKITGENPIQGGLYTANASKQNGNSLDASEWNNISGAVYTAHNKINDLVDDVYEAKEAAQQAAASAGGGTGLPSGIANNFELSGSGNNNMTIKSAKHLNLEPSYKTYDSTNGTWSSDNEGDLLLKPGDDISLYSHHRAADKRDEVSIKVLDGNDHPVKLLIQAGELTLLAKQKNLTKVKDSTTGEDSAGSTDDDYLYNDDQAGVFDINVTKEYKPNRGSSAKVSGKGYLKVRAQAIDLRCEDHGGIALQPKGEDSQHHMNKIKFEHGGGDGLEFGTFNAEKTSIYTDEYRFNKNGVWKMATRTKKVSDKYDNEDETTHYKYQKQADDFYDIVNNAENTCTTKNIIDTASLFNTQLNSNFNAIYISPLNNDIVRLKSLTVESVLDPTGITAERMYPGDIANVPGDDTYSWNNVVSEYRDLFYGLPSTSLGPTHVLIVDWSQSDESQMTPEYISQGGEFYKLTPEYDVISISDIFDLITYFKNGDGQNDGPWASQL